MSNGNKRGPDGYLCCHHCKEDEIHDVKTDGHDVPCQTCDSPGAMTLERAESAEAEVARLTRLLEQRTAALTRTIDAKDAAEAKVTRVEALIGNWEAAKVSPESDAWTHYVAERVRNALSGDYSSETQAGGS